MNTKPKLIALIPARAGSSRLPDKNIRPLAGAPLLAYTVASALQSGIFDSVVVSTDAQNYAEIAKNYGAEVPFLRPREFAGDKSPDFEWVQYTLGRLKTDGRAFDVFSILRPTSPFRMPETIQRAWVMFSKEKEADSLRAVELCKQHPGKMWTLDSKWMRPLLESENRLKPFHSTPYHALGRVYVQNASLEMAHTRVVFENGTIAGDRVLPFFTQAYEGFDINDSLDWRLAEQWVQQGVSLPEAVKSCHA